MLWFAVSLAIELTGNPLEALLSPEQHEALKTVYQKRHVNTHNGGVINVRCVKILPESASQLASARRFRRLNFMRPSPRRSFCLPRFSRHQANYITAHEPRGTMLTR